MNTTPDPSSGERTGCDGLQGDTKNLSESPPESNAQLIDFVRPMGIQEILSEEEFVTLASHLQNGNGPTGFGMAISNPDGSTSYATSKTQRFSVAVSSSWGCIIEPQELPFAATVYASNESGMSCWAAFDIDAHSPKEKRQAEWYLRKIASGLKSMPDDSPSSSPAVLVETSGRGFHVWFISPDMKRTSDWRRELHDLMRASGIDSEGGLEIYPSSESKSRGRALRLPGTANPNAWNAASGNYPCSMIIAERGIRGLVGSLTLSGDDLLSEEIGNKREVLFINRKKRDSEKVPPPKPKELRDHPDAKRLLDRYAITAPSSRHNQLCSLVGDGFFHFSRSQLLELAQIQHEIADPVPTTGFDEHIKEFEEAYDGWNLELETRMSEEELTKLKNLRNENQKKAFIIAQNFARHAKASRKWGPDGRFPLSGLDLATRLGMHHNSTYSIIQKLVRIGAIKRVEGHKPGVAATKYVWQLAITEKRME